MMFIRSYRSVFRNVLWLLGAGLMSGGIWFLAQDKQPKLTSSPEPLVTDLPRTTPALEARSRHFEVSAETDNEVLTKEALHHQKTHPGVFRFAKPIEVALSPSNAGEWSREGSEDVWKLNVSSPGAVNLNLSLSRFALPEGAKWSVRAPASGDNYVFTSKHHQPSGELWTPVFSGDELELEVRVASKDRSKVALDLRSIQHGFRPILKANTGELAGSCHIDTICSSSDLPVVGAILDEHRDQVRSVAAYSVDGMDICTGVLINNTSQNGRRLMLTAFHCGITPDNADSLIVYWNSDNPVCRERSTSGIDIEGGGDQNDVTMGAIVRARYEPSDMCLVELTDSINPIYNVYFAGWSRDPEPPTGYVFGLHHPGGSEKRFAIATEPLEIGDYHQSIGEDTHWEVPFWDHGSTSPGSSGSPLFNQDGLIIGQLEGGFSSCGAPGRDWYGRIANSWVGGGTPQTGLSTWLDPANSAPLTMEGMSVTPNVTMVGAEVEEGDSGTTEVEMTLELSAPADQEVALSWRTVDDTAIAGEDYVAAEDGRVVFPAGETSQTLTVEIIGDETPEEDEEFRLEFYDVDNGIRPRPPVRVRILNDDFIAPEISDETEFEIVQDQILELHIGAANSPKEFSLASEVPGAQIDNDGLLTWIPNEPGTFEFEIVAENPAGTDTQTIMVTVEENPLREALDAEDLPWRTGGNAPWVVTDDDAEEGDESASSGPIDNGESSWIETEVTGPDTMLFHWQVLSEPRFDFLSVLLDGEIQGSISGEVDWTRYTLEIPAGTHRVRWEYRKDFTISVEDELALIDNVSLVSQTGNPILSVPSVAYVIVGEESDLRIRATGSGNTYSATGLPNGLELDEVTGVISGTPNSPTTATVTFEVENDAGTHEANMSLLVLEALPASVGNAIGSPELTFYQHQPPRWGVSSAMRFNGVPSLASGEIGDNESSWLTTIVQGPGEIRFSWRASTEEFFDGLVLLMNDRRVNEIYGVTGWEEFVLQLPPGEQILQWGYLRNGSNDGGSDTTWVAGFSLSGFTDWAAKSGLPLADRRADADPDNDGRSNLLEYVMGSNPVVRDSAPLLDWETDVMERIVRFEKPDSNTELEYTVEYSSSLEAGSWSSEGLEVLEDGEDILRVQIPDEVASGSEGFVRLRISW